MINLLLQYPLFYRLYQKTVRKKNHEYDLFKFIFSEISKNKKIKMLDLCSGDSFVLKYVGNYVSEYVGIDNNEKYLKSLKSEWPQFKFINADITKLDNLDDIKDYEPNLIFMNGAIHHLDNNTMGSINNFISKFKNCVFISVDPVNYKNRLINKLMIFFDRGKFIRKNQEYKVLMSRYDQLIVDDFYQMSFQNIFHYMNINIPKLYEDWKSLVK
jgi:trans-aconitate methyltransferase